MSPVSDTYIILLVTTLLCSSAKSTHCRFKTFDLGNGLQRATSRAFAGEPDLHEEVESCVAAKSVLLQRIQQLELPPNFLDELGMFLPGEARRNVPL